MVLLVLACYIGLGWAVWSDQIWLLAVVGADRFEHLHTAYGDVMATLLPGDQDGDGVSDGAELFLRTNPGSPRLHPPLGLHWERGGFIAYDTTDLTIGGPMDSFVFYDLLPQADRRVVLRGRVLLEDRHHSFPSGFQLRLTPPAHGQLALPGGVPSTSPLLVPVAADGTFAFELQVLEGADVDAQLREVITVDTATTTERLDEVGVRYLHSLSPPAPVAIVESRPSGGDSRTHTSYGTCRTIHLQWLPGNPSALYLLLEAARDETGAEWFPIYLYPPATTTCSLSHLVENLDYPYTGRLKFRITPLGPPKP